VNIDSSATATLARYSSTLTDLLGVSQKSKAAAFTFRPSAYTQDGVLSHAGTFQLCVETKGPDGEVYQQTRNRAELRTAVAALQFRDWAADCNKSWRSIVIATDSHYVANSATDQIHLWEHAGWTTPQTSLDGVQLLAKNVDLWKLLLTEIRRLQAEGVSVSFWKIERVVKMNGKLDAASRLATTFPERMDFQKLEPRGPIEARFKPYTY
jgi:ribonuclease HI